MRFWVCLVVFLAQPLSVSAGAWLQATGAVFGSATLQWRNGRPAEFGLFAEYGLQDWVTIGLDLNQRSDQVGHALVFARVPIHRFGDKGRLAFQLAAGGHKSPWGNGAMLRATVLYGTSLGPKGSGWLGIEAAIEHREGLGPPLLKLDAVAGIPTQNSIQPMIKFESFYKKGYGVGWAVTPQLVFAGKGDTRWIAGVEYRRGGGKETVGVTFGVWQRF